MKSGQVMLITVLALSGTILGATTIAGLLMLYQMRQASDIANSTKAIFAADTGIEWRLYKFFKADKDACLSCPDGGACPAPTLANGATFTSTCDSQTVNGVQTVTIRSTGVSQNNARAFEITLTQTP
ncbi:MAG: hypothetical protein KGI60_00160 [Patescibacteria group bacterium]|nr:hypothetical protein [Patescibacteria group bacterium]